MSGRLELFQARIGYTFADQDLLERALTHASYGDGRQRAQSNERLEFLGDRVLGLIAAERLHEAFESMNEGGLAQRLNALVRKEACARVARLIGLGEALRLSKAEERLGGRDKTSILGDACEAIIGALYLDGGLDQAKVFFDTFWAEEFEAQKGRKKDAKSHLQEWAAKQGFGVPIYEDVSRKGPDHRPIFVVRVSVPGYTPVEAEGGSKQDAQRAAAAGLLEQEHIHGYSE
ncbi:ribonuclease III [Woodsholea maritima]|uniref:ribonuclease III n=1 Tax=Woodsholea maritima TaxID=240237 RepID=UPI00035F9EC8|nr:ribonuclease III [Woodsholea maritima]